MEDASELERMERERAALLAGATQIVQTAEAHSRKVTAEEDVRVLTLMDVCESPKTSIPRALPRSATSMAMGVRSGRPPRMMWLPGMDSNQGSS